MHNRTKNMFAEALMELNEQKPLDKITVTDLISYCHVNRHTFYYHFKDKYDLISYILINLTKKFLLIAEDDGNAMNINYYSLLLTHVQENKRFYKSVFSNDFPYSLIDVWMEFDIELYRFLARKTLNTDTLSKEADASIRFALYGAYGLFIDWIKNDCQESIDELVHHTAWGFSLIYNQEVGNISISKHVEECIDEQEKALK